jgi:hypothetical protein
MAERGRVDAPDWIRSLAATRPFGAGDRRGTANLILTWAIGLLLLDNCDFAALRRARGQATQVAGALVVSLLAVEGANGANLNPLVLC